MRRFWLSVGDGTTYGPYTEDELKAYAADGRVTASSMLCEEGMQQWVPAATVIQGLAALPPIAPDAGGVGGAALVPVGTRVRMAWPVVTLIASIVIATCVPIGLVAFLYARRANAHYEAGEAEAGDRCASSWRVWAILSWIVNALFIYLTWRTVSSCMSFLDQV